MTTVDYEVLLPEKNQHLDQHEEWFLVDFGSHKKKFRIHEYDRIYRVPGLYEEVVYDRLQCCSPGVVCSMLKQEMQKHNGCPRSVRVFDFGAGNGVVGEILREEFDLECLVGGDIYPEAKDAAQRDRKGVYDDYHVLDLTSLSEKEKAELSDYRFNVLVTVAALGFDDICSEAFVNAFNLLPNGAWVAFNIRDKFLEDGDKSGFKQTLEGMLDGSLEVKQTRRYCHRISIGGERLYYIAIVGRKIRDSVIGVMRHN